jgi:hypothetical protein
MRIITKGLEWLLIFSNIPKLDLVIISASHKMIIFVGIEVKISNDGIMSLGDGIRFPEISVKIDVKPTFGFSNPILE